MTTMSNTTAAFAVGRARVPAQPAPAPETADVARHAAAPRGYGLYVAAVLAVVVGCVALASGVL